MLVFPPDASFRFVGFRTARVLRKYLDESISVEGVVGRTSRLRFLAFVDGYIPAMERARTAGWPPRRFYLRYLC